ncbi:MAG: pimeloyl-ACP methyl ester carboxylesterase [Candidatus Latescibacterota bacterium]|jgi:pimeloyl-ACP methyl ester carboxylesterase
MITHYRHTPIFYETCGTGPALILLHGFLESSSMWQAVVNEFKSTFQVVTIDLPGHGKSGCFSEVHTMEEMADVVMHILDELSVPSATIIGHSMGGYVALAILELFEIGVDKLILLNSTSLADDHERKKNRNRAVALLERNNESYVRMSLTNLYTENARIRFASEIELQKLEALKSPAVGLQAAHLGMRDRPDRTLVLENFSKEKWIIAGEEDTIVPLASIEHVAKITHTHLMKIKGGHMLLTENKEETIKTLRLVV